MLSFSPIEELDRTLYRSHVKSCGFYFPSCEFAYANLFAWSGMYQTSFAADESGFYFLMHHDGEQYFLCPVTSPERAGAAFDTLCSYMRGRGADRLNLICLPKVFADRLAEQFPGVSLANDRGNADYLYKTQSLATFSGKALHAKKNHRNKFFSLYAESYEYRVMTAADAPLCRDFNRKWYSLNAEYIDEEFSAEHKATNRLLDNFEPLGLCGGMLFADGTLCAYTLASDNYDGSNTLIIHTEKGLYDIPGVYPTICSEFLLHSGADYEFVNREDDLNDEGLRKSKLSYNPIGFEEKYSAVVPL